MRTGAMENWAQVSICCPLEFAARIALTPPPYYKEFLKKADNMFDGIRELFDMTFNS